MPMRLSPLHRPTARDARRLRKYRKKPFPLPDLKFEQREVFSTGSVVAEWWRRWGPWPRMKA